MGMAICERGGRMIYIYDRLSKKFLYVNKNHIIHASEWVGAEIYTVYLTNGIKLLIDDDDFNKILKEM